MIDHEQDILVAQGATRTFQKDMQQALSGERGALVKEAIEREHLIEDEKNIRAHSKKMQKILGISTGIVLLSAIGIFIYANVNKNNESVAPSYIYPSMIVGSEIEPKYKVTEKNSLSKDIALLYIKDAALGDIHELQYQNSLYEFLKIIDPNIPNKVLAGIGTSYSVGVYETTDGPAPFILLSDNGSDGFFEGVSLWEKTIKESLFPVFQIITSPDDPLLTKDFENVVIQNKDTRILYDELDEPIFFITFLNDKRLLIGTNPEIIGPLLEKIRAVHNQQI